MTESTAARTADWREISHDHFSHHLLCVQPLLAFGLVPGVQRRSALSLSAKIHSSFWSDEDIGNLTPLQKLAVAWVWTNKDRNNIGYTKGNKRQFEFDTGMPIEHLEGACKGLPRSLLLEPCDGGFEVLAVHFAHHQFTDNSITEKNYIYAHLCRLTLALNPRFQSAILERYPLLQRGFEALASPLRSASPLKGLISPKRREEERREEYKGGAGGNGDPASGRFAEIPSDEEVFAFCLEWPGEPASATPAIPRAYAEEWVARMAGRTSGWPPDWKRKLKADWRKEHRTWKPVEAKKTAPQKKRRAGTLADREGFAIGAGTTRNASTSHVAGGQTVAGGNQKGLRCAGVQT